MTHSSEAACASLNMRAEALLHCGSVLASLLPLLGLLAITCLFTKYSSTLKARP
jgi:hypothetical protein